MRLRFWKKTEDSATRIHRHESSRDLAAEHQREQIDSARNVPNQTNTGMTSGTSGI